MNSNATLLRRTIVDNQDQRNWKAIALYLANCHAATAEREGRMASIPKGRRRRYADICRRACNLFEEMDLPDVRLKEGDVYNRLLRGIEIACP